MMDYKLIYSDDQAVTTTAVSTNNVNLGAASLDLGRGTAIWLIVLVTTGFTTSANTITVALQDSDTDGSYAAVLTFPAKAASLLTAPCVFWAVPLLQGLKQYSQLNYTCSAAVAAGAISAFLWLGGNPPVASHL